jgi:glycosyltransferase involved in cell wall biosynthesis
MYEPEVSIIIPTSNIVENNQTDDFTLLLNLLDMQTYEFVEHIVVDNASKDGTEVLLKEYKNSGYINFYSEPDRGKFDAMNKGLMRAKGKYVAFLSCDDFYHDITAISDIVNIMEQEDADFCFFPSYCRHPEGYVFQFVPSMLSTFQVAPCPRQAVFFKKSVLSELGGFDDKFKLLADYDLMVRLVLGGYKGIFFDSNVLTYKLGEQVEKYSMQVEAECNHIYYKNYKNLYPLSEEDLDRMVKLSEIPKPLLDRLAQCFPKEDSALFYERYQALYNMRVEAARNLREQEKREKQGM